MDIYLIWKLLHVLAAIIFLGNITIGAFWKFQADKSKDRSKIADTFKTLIKADRVFTMPSVTLLIIFGLGTAMQGNLSLVETPWILWGMIMVIISAIAFMSKVVPLQKKIVSLASNEQKFKWEDYEALSKSWNLWGTVATVAPYIAIILMVLKPM
ncbi:MAG: DUF2269 domain-containing protein [Bacteroidetes bacterium]|nr:DUF2269 domain-containing protein [Bacteroidota bacterium]